MGGIFNIYPMNRHFNVLVAGKNHAELMGAYDSRLVVPEYVAYEYKKAELYRKEYLDGLRAVIDKDPRIEEEIKEIESESIEDFYLDLTQNYDLDPETGNAICRNNPNGKYDSAHVARNFANPFILKDGTESFSAEVKDIDWEKMVTDKTPYELAWDLVMGKKKPKGDYEKSIYENMKNRTAYFRTFGSKENYVTISTAFWCFAFVSEKGEWTELEPTCSQFDWVKNFYDRFVKKLKPSTLLTLYECSRD